ncbi:MULTISPECIES: hypothetical protein [Streptomyces]|jgi:hypothetical protein|uniref:C2H2-type domain-containing protein n=1 Tax=Streptomyces sp. 900129855 TaxID=3155129 RepID=A0ABV2ZJJ9_9ACTN
MIRVQPVRELRVDFARWAVAQTPKVRTCSTTEFEVPPALFTNVPERLLIGSIVDGHPYVSALDDEVPAEELDWLAAIPGEPLPPVSDSTYPPDAIQMPEPERQLAATSPATVEAAMMAVLVAVDTAAANRDQAAGIAPSEGEGATPACDACARPFKTQRGLETHRRQAHPEA